MFKLMLARRAGGWCALLLLTACATPPPEDANARTDATALVALRQGKYAEAAAIYEELLAQTSDGKPQPARQSRLAEVHYQWALAGAAQAAEARSTTGYAEAVGHCQRATELDPRRQRKFKAAADQFVAKMDALAFAQATAESQVDPQAAQRQLAIDILMKQGERLFANGRLMGASDKYRAVLALDPYHREAIVQMQRIAKESTLAAQDRRRADEAERMAEVEWRYVQPPLPPAPAGVAPDAATAPAPPPTLAQRLDRIVFRNLDFTEAPLPEVLAALTAGSRIPEVPDGVSFKYENLDPADADWPTITIQAEEVSLREVLDAICPAVGIVYALGDEAIVLRPAR